MKKVTKAMKKTMLTIGAIALFIGIAFIPAGANLQVNPAKTETTNTLGSFWYIGWIEGEPWEENGETYVKAVFLLVAGSNYLRSYTKGVEVWIGSAVLYKETPSLIGDYFIVYGP